MTPREPDRYEEKANELLRTINPFHVPSLAAALRQAADEALERAYTKVNDLVAEFGENPASALSIVSGYVDEALHGVLRRRALASPAAAPAADQPSEPVAPAGSDVEERATECERDRDELLRKLRVMCDAHSDLSARGMLNEQLLSACETALRTLPLNYQPADLLARLAARRAALADGGE